MEKLDNSDRLKSIKEAFISILEINFGQRKYETENPPDYDLGTDPTSAHRLGWVKPDLDTIVGNLNMERPPSNKGDNWMQDDAIEQKAKSLQSHYQRMYNLYNQRGLDAFNPDAKTQNYGPSWNVRGDERREQNRAYLNYIRSDPERLARFRAQSRNNTIATRRY